MVQMKCVFLELPDEIRNAIYEYYAASIITLRINIDGFAVPPPLIQTCRQVRRETFDLLGYDHGLAGRVDLEAKAPNHKYSHILTYVERNKEHSKDATRKLSITVNFASHRLLAASNPVRFNVSQWLKAAKTHLDRQPPPPRNDMPTTLCGLPFHIDYHGNTDAVKLNMIVRRLRLLRLEHHIQGLVEQDDLVRRSTLWSSIQPAYSRVAEWRIPLVTVNHAAFRKVSKSWRPHAEMRWIWRKYDVPRLHVLQEVYIPTSMPRPELVEAPARKRKKRPITATPSSRRTDAASNIARAERLLRTLKLDNFLLGPACTLRSWEVPEVK